MVKIPKYGIEICFQDSTDTSDPEIEEYKQPPLNKSEKTSPKSHIPWGPIVAAVILVLLNSVQPTTSSPVKAMKARKYVVKNHFQGVPKISDYEVVEYDLPPLKDGDILIKAEWISVDPYMRYYNMDMPIPYDQFGFQVGIVEMSQHPDYPVGTRVVSHKGWCDYSVVNVPNFSLLNGLAEFTYKMPDLKGLSPSISIGAAGMTGLTAYFGLLEICQPKKGETVVVTGAAGAVGSIAGQIAKIKGSKVIGFAGSDDKVQWLEKELGFDKAINYKTADIQKALQAAAPNGVDCYFDNVGGEISSIIISQMNQKGRVAACGSISSYNEDPKQMPKATIIQQYIVFKELKIEGFLVHRWFFSWPNAVAQLVDWIKSGDLKIKEHVVIGFDQIFDAFVGMLAGENTGKAIVKI